MQNKRVSINVVTSFQQVVTLATLLQDFVVAVVFGEISTLQRVTITVKLNGTTAATNHDALTAALYLNCH